MFKFINVDRKSSRSNNKRLELELPFHKQWANQNIQVHQYRSNVITQLVLFCDDIIKWKHLPR